MPPSSASPPESRPPAWLTFLAPLIFSLVVSGSSLAVGWGALSNRVEGAERRMDRLELDLGGLREWRSRQDVVLAELKKDVEATRDSARRIEHALVTAGAAKAMSPAGPAVAQDRP